MADNPRAVPGRSQRLTLAKFNPPDWFGWLGVTAMFLLPAVRVRLADGAWFFPLLSLGEWLLMPLGVLSLTMGFLSLSPIREKTLLPLWISAILPAVLWLAAVGLAMLGNGVGHKEGDLYLSWWVHLVFPSLAFLPLLTIRPWRDRLMWALAGGLAANAVLIFFQGRALGQAMPHPEYLGLGGLLVDQHDYGLMLAVCLPLLAAWRGGNGEGGDKPLFVLLFTFLLPVLALEMCFTWMGLAAAAAGLLVAWAAWRSHAWIMGVFLVLLVFGYGAESRRLQEQNQRRLLAESAAMAGNGYRRALNTFQARPFLGSGLEAFMPNAGNTAENAIADLPWYATLLGGTGLLGLGMWLALLAELAARAMGRIGRRCLWHGGVLGGVAAAGVAGFWADCLPEGAGAMLGLLVAISILEEPDPPAPPKNLRKKTPPPPPAAPKRSAGGDTDIIPKPGPAREE